MLHHRTTMVRIKDHFDILNVFGEGGRITRTVIIDPNVNFRVIHQTFPSSKIRGVLHHSYVLILTTGRFIIEQLI